ATLTGRLSQSIDEMIIVSPRRLYFTLVAIYRPMTIADYASASANYFQSLTKALLHPVFMENFSLTELELFAFARTSATMYSLQDSPYGTNQFSYSISSP